MIPARLLSLSEPIQSGTSNKTWTAQVVCESDQEVSVVLKTLSQREFFNELLAAAIGKSLELKIPDVYLVAAHDQPALSSALLLPSGDRLCFGSAFVNLPAFNTALNISPTSFTPSTLAALGEALKKWPRYGEAIGFDTWIANIDRNVQNLLFSPDGEHHLIDHGRCLSGPSWAITDLDPAKQHLNLLAVFAATLIADANSKQKVRNAIIDLNIRAASVSPRSHINPLRDSGWISEAEAIAVEQYLSLRCHQIVPHALTQSKV